MGVYSTTAANAYADKIKVVYEYLDEIRKVAGRLTPVEDLISFQEQISDLHSRLDLLVEASNIIVTATPIGEDILTGSRPSIRALLGIGDIDPSLVTRAELEAAIAGLQAGVGSGLSGLSNSIQEINLVLTELEQYAVQQQTEISGLQTSYASVAAGLETNQTNTQQALTRLTVREQHATLQDQRLDTIDQSLISTMLGVQATNATVAGHTSSITTAENAISLHTSSIDSLASTLTILGSDTVANTTAIDLMETTITAIGDDIVAQSQRTTELMSVISGGGSNLLPYADFASNTAGWEITVAEGDWASTLLTTNLFSMPPEVNCLEVLGTPAPLGKIVVESLPVLIEAGKTHIVSGYPCVDNGTVTLSFKTFNAAGAVLDQGECPATFNTTTSTNIGDYQRTWIKFLPSAAAVKMRLYLTVTGDGDWLVQGALFRPMIEQGWAGQEEPSAWNSNLSGDTEALATAVQTLTTRVSEVEDGFEAQAEEITSLHASIEGIEIPDLDAIRADLADARLRIRRITDDEIISQEEKPQLIIDYGAIVNEYPGILAEADESELEDEVALYNTAYNALAFYMATLTTPVPWNDTSDYTNLT